MVGKSRNTQRGTTRSTTGGGSGGGPVSNRTDNLPNRDEFASFEEQQAEQIEDTTRDITGRGTPGGYIADLAQGKVPGERGESNLGTRAGRTPEGADIPGGGSSTRKKAPQQPGERTHET